MDEHTTSPVERSREIDESARPRRIRRVECPNLMSINRALAQQVRPVLVGHMLVTRTWYVVQRLDSKICTEAETSQTEGKPEP